MKRLASAITLSIASTLATAADPQVRVDESLVLAYNTATAAGPAAKTDTVASEASLKAMHRTLDEVSASLGAELDARIAALMTAQAE